MKKIYWIGIVGVTIVTVLVSFGMAKMGRKMGHRIGSDCPTFAGNVGADECIGWGIDCPV